MTFIARLALALALIVPLWRSVAQCAADIRPIKGRTAPLRNWFARRRGRVPSVRHRGHAAAGASAHDTRRRPPRRPDWGNSQVDVVYAEPQDPQFLPIRERLMRRQVLEQLRLFLSPLRLPRKLLVQIDQCNAERRPYQPGGPVTICYEYIAKVDRIAPRNAAGGRATARNDDRRRVHPGGAARSRGRDLRHPGDSGLGP